jgi:argininosuccinate lyase
MPTTVGTWLGSYSDALEDATSQIDSVQKIVDKNPLGSGAGFGFIGQELQPDKRATTRQLGFALLQNNPMYCGMSRGNFELFTLQAIEPIMLLASQFASDMLLFTMSEFGFVSLPKNFTTGSSIMPQKHNYDCLEVMRGSESIFWGYIEQIHGLVAKKTSGYQRDLQLSKKPLIEGIALALDTITMWLLCAKNLLIDIDNLEESMSPEIYATAKANELVLDGMSFRDAYITIKKEMEK